MRGVRLLFSCTWCGSVAAASAALMLIGSPAWAADDDMSAVRQDIKALKEAVERLDQHMQDLDRRLATQPQTQTQPAIHGAAPERAPARAAAPEPPVAAKMRTPSAQTMLRDQWQTIKRGMPIREIEALLGQPDRTVPLPGKTVWYYSYPDIGSGSVVFAEDGEVMDWQAPPFSTWAW